MFRKHVLHMRHTKSVGIVESHEILAFDDVLEDIPKRSKKSQLWNQFQRFPLDESLPPIPAPIIEDARNNCTEVFICHAQVYVFAEKYDIETLKELSLNKLRHALITFHDSHKQRIGDIVVLLKYVYENTIDLVDSEEKLRALVVHYAACVVEEVTPNSNFQSLLVDKGELGRDLLKRLISRLD